MSAFILSCNSSVRLPIELIQGSVAFPQGATGLSHVPPWCESIPGVTVDAVQVNQVHMEWMRHLGVFWNGGRTPGVPLDFPFESTSS